MKKLIGITAAVAAALVAVGAFAWWREVRWL